MKTADNFSSSSVGSVWNCESRFSAYFGFICIKFVEMSQVRGIDSVLWNSGALLKISSVKIKIIKLEEG